MGSWIGLNQFKYYKKQIRGFIGIGSAPEFLDRLMWKKFPKKIKNEIVKKGITTINHGGKTKYQYPISYQLIKDGRKNKVLRRKISSKIDVTMIHGQKDEIVPVSFSRLVLKVFSKAKKKVVIIKNSDHSLSNQRPLRIIIKELHTIVKNII